MEVRKLALAVAFLILAACQQNKSVDSVANYKNGSQSQACPSSAMVKNRFLVKYEDGRVEVIQAENETVFERDFIKPRLNEIKRVEYDSVVKLVAPMASESTLDDPGTKDWGQPMIHADAVWNQGIYGQGVTVAVVDTAVDITHPQLIPRFAINDKEANGNSGVDDDNNGYVDDMLGWDFIRNAPPAVITDKTVYHGTHVAGIIAADPTKGPMSGVAPQAKLIQASFLDDDHGDMSNAILAIQYAASRGARIINASWGGKDCSETLKETIADVGNKGVLFVVASSNEGYDYDRLGPSYYRYPAVFNLPNMLSVAATDIMDQMTDFSNRSYSLVHIGAPGSSIRSTVPTAADSTGYAALSGTSMAAPFVSGAAALLWSAKPNATVAQIRQAIVSSTDFRSYKVSTQGRLNVEKALTEIRRIVP